MEAFEATFALNLSIARGILGDGRFSGTSGSDGGHSGAGELPMGVM